MAQLIAPPCPDLAVVASRRYLPGEARVFNESRDDVAREPYNHSQGSGEGESCDDEEVPSTVVVYLSRYKMFFLGVTSLLRGELGKCGVDVVEGSGGPIR